MKARKALIFAIAASCILSYAFPAGRRGQLSILNDSSQEYQPNTSDDHTSSEESTSSSGFGDVEHDSEEESQKKARASTAKATKHMMGDKDLHSSFQPTPHFNKAEFHKEISGAGLTKDDNAFVIDSKSREIMKKYDPNTHASAALLAHLEALQIKKKDVDYFRGLRTRRFNRLSKKRIQSMTSKKYTGKYTLPISKKNSDVYKAKRQRRRKIVQNYQDSTLEDIKMRLKAAKASYDLDPATYAEREDPVREFYGTRQYGQWHSQLMQMANVDPRWIAKYRTEVKKFRRPRYRTLSKENEEWPLQEVSQSGGSRKDIEPASDESLKVETSQHDRASLTWTQRKARSKPFKVLRKDGKALQRSIATSTKSLLQIQHNEVGSTSTKRKHAGLGVQEATEVMTGPPSVRPSRSPIHSMDLSSPFPSSKSDSHSSKQLETAAGLSHSIKNVSEDYEEQQRQTRILAAKRPRQLTSSGKVTSRSTVAKKTFRGAAQRNNVALIKPVAPPFHL